MCLFFLIKFYTNSLFVLQLLQQNLETNFYSGHVSWDEVSPNDAAALLKKFIRELPAPLLTAEYLNTFSAVRGQWTVQENSFWFCGQTFLASDCKMEKLIFLFSYIMTRPVIDHTVHQHTGVTEVTECIWKVVYCLSLYTTETFCCPRFQAAQQGSHHHVSRMSL